MLTKWAAELSLERVGAIPTAQSEAQLFKTSKLPFPTLIQRSALPLLLKLKLARIWKHTFRHSLVESLFRSMKHDALCAYGLTPSPTWSAFVIFHIQLFRLSKSNTSKTSIQAQWATINLPVSYMMFARGWEILEIKVPLPELDATLYTFCY